MPTGNLFYRNDVIGAGQRVIDEIRSDRAERLEALIQKKMKPSRIWFGLGPVTNWSRGLAEQSLTSIERRTTEGWAAGQLRAATDLVYMAKASAELQIWLTTEEFSVIAWGWNFVTP